MTGTGRGLFPNGDCPRTPSDLIKTEAARLGFPACGIVKANAIGRREPELKAWLAAGRDGGLGYMQAFFDRRRRLLEGFPTFKTALVLAVPYARRNPPADPAAPVSGGRIARYARGRDYHPVISKRLRRLEQALRALFPKSGPMRPCVDTSPLQERALAEAAGLGFFGKNGCLIDPKSGSFFFLCALLTDLDLPADQPMLWDCGGCTRCITACPTGALEPPYQVNAGRCITLLTIENRGPIPEPLREKIGPWLFGCDICQEVCPYNKGGTGGSDPVNLWPELRPEQGAGERLPLSELLRIRTEADFLSRFQGTPLTRPKREGLLRNAAVAAGNSRNPALIPALREAAKEDLSPMVREHAAWALARLE